MRPLLPLYMIDAGDLPRVEARPDGKWAVKIGTLTLLFPDATTAEAAIDTWQHELRTQTVGLLR